MSKSVVFFIVMSLVLTSCGSQPKPGTTAGILVKTQDGKQMGGTIFVAMLNNNKVLCTVSHIGVRANKFGIAKLDDSFKLVGEFQVVGDSGGSESVMCASVVTDWEAFTLELSEIAPLNAEGVVFLPLGKMANVTTQSFTESTQEVDMQSGLALVTTANSAVIQSSSGAPLTINGKVYGVVSGGNNIHTFISAFKYK